MITPENRDRPRPCKTDAYSRRKRIAFTTKSVTVGRIKFQIWTDSPTENVFRSNLYCVALYEQSNGVEPISKLGAYGH